MAKHVLMQKMVSTSHPHREWAYKKTWPAGHSKKPTLVEGVHDCLGNLRYE
jgi:hypothetical protein